ncbi:MAG TPA: hypothetical protein VK457_25700 [Chloroflexota bacterium]|nr:hypothetical protein [Chloroflexota bacterium]
MQSAESSSTSRAESARPKLCRYCRRFVGQDGKHGICGKCWELETETSGQ